MKRVVATCWFATVLIGSAAQAATLSLTDKLTAYHTASPAERSAVVPLALAAVSGEIDRKEKTDTEIGGEILPCMDSVDAQVSEADRDAARARPRCGLPRPAWLQEVAKSAVG